MSIRRCSPILAAEYPSICFPHPFTSVFLLVLVVLVPCDHYPDATAKRVLCYHTIRAAIRVKIRLAGPIFALKTTGGSGVKCIPQCIPCTLYRVRSPPITPNHSEAALQRHSLVNPGIAARGYATQLRCHVGTRDCAATRCFFLLGTVRWSGGQRLCVAGGQGAHETHPRAPPR